jgi:hypothetical protein
MSLSKSKSKIIEKLKLLISIANSDIDVKSYEELINQSDDPIDFVINILKSTVGENVVEGLVQIALSKIITQKKLDEFSDQIYDEMGKNLSETSFLPDSIKNNGLTMPIKSFDVSDSFRRVNTVASTALQNTNPFFQQMVNNVLVAPNINVNLNSSINIPGVGSITAKYNEANSEIKVFFPNVSQKSLFELLRGTVGPLFSANVVVNEIINLLFHTDFNKQDAKIATLVRSYVKNDSVEGFKLDLKSLLEIENATSIKGLTVDVGCFSENIEVTQSQINAVIANPTVQTFNALVPEFGQQTDPKSNAQNAYQVDIIKKIIEAIINMIIKQPGVIFIMNIIKKISDLNFNFEISIEGIWEIFKNLLLRIFDNIYEIFFCVILEYLKNFIIKLVIVVTIKFLKEQLEKRKDVLLSLSTGGLSNRLKETAANLI